MANITYSGLSLAGSMALKSQHLAPTGLRTHESDRCADPMEALRRIRAAVKAEVAAPDRADAAMEILTRLYAEARAETNGATCDIRRDRLRMAYLRLEARSEERRRAKRRSELHAESAATGLGDMELAGNPHDDGTPPLAMGPAHAKAGARQLCAMLGMRTGGKVETAFYAYLRGDDIRPETIAEEIGQTHGAVRNALSQASALIVAAYPSPADLLRAFGALDRAEAGAPETITARTRAAMKGHRRDSWRDRQPSDAPVRYAHAVPTRLPISDARKLALAFRARAEARRDPRMRKADKPLTGYRIPRNMRGKAGMAHLAGKPLPWARLTGGDRR